MSLLSDTVQLFVYSALQCPCCPILYSCLSCRHYSVPAVRYCTAVCLFSITVSLLSYTVQLFVLSALVSLLSDIVQLFVQSTLQCPCCQIQYSCLSCRHYSVPTFRYCTVVCPVSITVSLLSDNVQLFVQSALQCPCCPILYSCLSCRHYSVPAARYCTVFDPEVVCLQLEHWNAAQPTGKQQLPNLSGRQIIRLSD